MHWAGVGVTLDLKMAKLREGVKRGKVKEVNFGGVLGFVRDVWVKKRQIEVSGLGS